VTGVLLPFLFIIALSNGIFLIAIFIIRKNPQSTLLRKVGSTYILLFIPAAIIGIVLSIIENYGLYYTTFLAIFLAFLGVEALFDYVLKVDFRKNWKLLIPYLALYYAMNYGLVVMVWKLDVILGMILLILFIAQIIVNILTHPPIRKNNIQPREEKVE